jgi:alkanesulfonate monooxygenase SsuD/methylene tetrahydromethanopterin reductase-like flavin-dependent oxidoreductase (luciferase family)
VAPLRVGLLEFGDLTLGAIIDVAQVADTLGYSRFWLAEHAGAIENARILTPLVAGSTSRIRVGPGGVLLRYSAAASVGRDGVLLERVFQGRIDLGLAAGRFPPGVDAEVLDGRTDAYVPSTFEAKLRVVSETVSRHEPEAERPEVWFLGGSVQRGESAARLHAHFALSLIHTPAPPTPDAIRAYREEEARLGLAPGHAVIALAMSCVESPREVEGYVSPYPGMPGNPFVGTGASCRERLEEMCAAYGATEVSVLEASHDFERRRASLTMLAEACGGLQGPAPKGRVPAPRGG